MYISVLILNKIFREEREPGKTVPFNKLHINEIRFGVFLNVHDISQRRK